MRAVCLGLLLAIGLAGASGASSRNGFALEPASVPVSEILAGGPPRDGIPSLDHPPAVAAVGAPWDDDAIVLGVVSGAETRAYPVAILAWHELVNDTLGGRPILVSYCPLCGTGLVFDRRIDGAARSFGVSGLLYRSDLLMFDRESESLWSQISAEAVTGASLGRRLEIVRSSMQRLGAWRRAHPATTVLSRETGYRRDYSRIPYGDYATSERLMFPVALDRRYHPKMPTLGLRRPGGAARAYPALELVRAGGAVAERFEGEAVRVAYDAEQQVFQVEAPDALEVVEGYWFAWAAFHPETTVFVHADASDRGSAPGPRP